MACKCNWCGNYFFNSKNKYYCQICKIKCVKECIRCHRPFPDIKYMSKENINYCKACKKTCDKNIERKERNFRFAETLSKYVEKLAEKKMKKDDKAKTLKEQINNSRTLVVKQPRKKSIKNESK